MLEARGDGVVGSAAKAHQGIADDLVVPANPIPTAPWGGILFRLDAERGLRPAGAPAPVGRFRPMRRNLPAPLPLPPEAMAELALARAALERESLTARLAALAGTPIERLKANLPDVAQNALDVVIRRTLSAALRTALRTSPMRSLPGVRPQWLQRGVTVASGIAGGAFGLPGTLVELPLSTTLLLRQIATEAVAAGEDPHDPETAVECLKVFALGGPGAGDDTVESGYFATRLALARFLPTMSATVLPGFLGAVAARFAGPLLLKLSAQAAPLLGAAAGGAVNLAFLEHFRRLAKAHFTVRRLERVHGAAAVHLAYHSMGSNLAAWIERRAQTAAAIS